jgi:hypothetical protein
MAIRPQRSHKKQKPKSAKLLGKEDIKRVAQTVAEKLGVLDAFNEIISGKRLVRERLDKMDLERIESAAQNTVVHLGNAEAGEKAEDGFIDKDMVFNVKEKTFVDRSSGPGNNENISPSAHSEATAKGVYSFDIGHLDSYVYPGNPSSYVFRHEDGSVI